MNAPTNKCAGRAEAAPRSAHTTTPRRNAARSREAGHLGERKPRLAQHTQPRRDATGTRGARIQQYKGGTPRRAEAAPRTAHTTTRQRVGHAARMPQYKACFTHARSTRLHSHTNAGPGRDTPLPQASLGSLGPLAPAQPAAQAHAARDAAYKTRLGYTFALEAEEGQDTSGGPCKIRVAKLLRW